MIQKNIIDSLEYTIKSTTNLLAKEDTIKDNTQRLQKNELKEKEEYLKFIKGC